MEIRNRRRKGQNWLFFRAMPVLYSLPTTAEAFRNRDFLPRMRGKYKKTAQEAVWLRKGRLEVGFNHLCVICSSSLVQKSYPAGSLLGTGIPPHEQDMLAELGRMLVCKISHSVGSKEG